MTCLHVGSGGASLPAWIPMGEVRLDIDPLTRPDIVASMTDMGDIGPFSAVYASHCLEHLYPHDVPRALSEFHRVLAPKGTALIIVPDLEDIRPTEEVVYESDGGPICGLDMYYGSSRLIPHSPHMAHHCGFIKVTLESALRSAGFSAQVDRIDGYQLLAVAVKQ